MTTIIDSVSIDDVKKAASDNNELTAKQLIDFAKRLKTDIDKAAIESFSEPFRTRLGIAKLENPCDAALWFGFRWVKPAAHTGRQLRLFKRGDREEPWFKDMLRAVGCTVEDTREQFLYWHAESEAYLVTDTEFYGDGLLAQVNHLPEHRNKAAKQGVVPEKIPFRVSWASGHCGGSLDCRVKLPESYGVDLRFVTEFKTQATGRGFSSLKTHGVAETKPEHFSQLSCYGVSEDDKYGLYLSVNKNDDDLHVELMRLNTAEQKVKQELAERIVFSPNVPDKNPETSRCKYCDYNDVCSGDVVPVKNCRSCKYLQPIEDAAWRCNFYGQNPPKHVIKEGCENWLSIV